MKLQLKRIAKKTDYTIGKLYIDGEYFCDTIEDKDRGLSSSMPISEINRLKVQSQTAIPTGVYGVLLNQVSPRFSQKEMYKSISGKLPRLVNIPGFNGVLIHIGNTEFDTSGCIIVGQNKQVGKVINSKETFFKLYPILQEAEHRNEDIIIEVQ